MIMKKLLFTIATLFVSSLVLAQTTTENYVQSTSYTEAYTKGSETSASNSEKISSITYFDGLGRAIQSIGIRAGGSSEDIITYIGYDDEGRQNKNYLPYAATSTGGTFRTSALTGTNNFYNNSKYDNTTNPYSETYFDASPFNRVLEQGAPGADWVVNKASDTDHTIKFEYETNTTSEVKHYTVSLSFANNTYTPTLVNSGSYVAKQLTKTVTKDENWTSGNNHTTEEFKDKQGRVVLKRTYGQADTNNDGDTIDAGESSVAHDTYYVYDNYGNLTYVLPPKSEAHSGIPNSTELSELCYQYKYDQRNRLVEKKIPGKDWESIVYNKLDQPVMTQDANLDANDEWLFTKYDAMGRVAYSGMMSYSSATTRITAQSNVNGVSTQIASRVSSPISIDGTNVYYDSASYPTSTSMVDELHTINYYDTYVDLPSGLGSTATTYYSLTSSTETKGLATVNKVRVLGTSSWITSVSYYDDKGRPIYMYSTNPYLGTTDIIETKYNFAGSPEEVKTTHKKTGESDLVTLEKLTYDHVGRVTKQTHKINSGSEEVIAENNYDNLGQLESKEVGNTVSNPLQTVNYTYNVRGWLKQINNPASLGTDLFGFKINYNTVDHSGTKLYNGNISETEWKTANTDSNLKWYKYDYDALNRITSATSISSNYHLEKVVYDLNGNITRLKRKGHTNSGASTFGTMDDLVYTYNTTSNQLKKVLDNGNDTYGFADGSNTMTEYTYDDNGNMLTDANKGISSNISYNHLNLPTLVTLSSGNISYIYDATGAKLKKTVSTGATTKYAGNFIYEDSGSGDELKFFNHPEGYIEPDGSGGYEYVYQYKDHLGNIRLSYKNTGSTGTPTLQIQEENNYYPFGLKHKGYNGGQIGTDHKYGYNGEEEEGELGKNVIAYQWRDYDPAIGRFNKIDRFAVKYYSKSTYGFSANNPIRIREIKGDSLWINTGTRTLLFQNGNLYNKKGKQVEKSLTRRLAAGKKVGGTFLKNVLSGLNSISNAEQENGTNVVSTLQNSNKNFTIQLGGNRFYSNQPGERSNINMNNSHAFASLISGTRPISNHPISGLGSGGIIYWNPNSQEKIITDNGVQTANTTMNLGHELFHAFDANFGNLDMRRVSPGGTENREARAVYFTNQLRNTKTINLNYNRTHYNSGEDNLRPVINGIVRPVNPIPASIEWMIKN